MIVYAGDWIKIKQWKQVVAVNPSDDTFATIDSDGDLLWWDTEDTALFLDHKSNDEMQALLREFRF